MTKIALAVSQNFEAVFPRLKDRVGSLVVNDLAKIVPGLRGYELTAHMNGFIDSDFDKTATPEFFSGLRRHGVELLSLDLGPACREVKLEEFYKPASPVLSPDEIVAIGRERLKTIRAGYSGAVSLENLDFHPGGAYDHVCDPSFIARALKDWDAGLTLDIGHMSVTCFQTGMDPKEFIRRLPLDRLMEVHVSHANGDDDTHALPTDADYALLDYLFTLARPRYLKLEYYWDADAIVRETLKLADFVAARVPARA